MLVRDDLIRRFDDVMDVLVHVDPEDDQVLSGQFLPLLRGDVQRLLEHYLADVKASIEDFRIHYLNGQIEVEVILPFAISAQAEQLTQLKKQCALMGAEVNQINEVFLFFKT